MKNNILSFLVLSIFLSVSSLFLGCSTTNVACLANCTFVTENGDGVIGLPTVASYPSTRTVLSGTSATFLATSTSPFASLFQYQWQRQVGGNGVWLDIPGATKQAYTIKNVSIAEHNDTLYRVMVTIPASGTRNYHSRLPPTYLPLLLTTLLLSLIHTQFYPI